MTATTRLSEIAASLQRGDALSGALEALEGWEARNIGAARMRAHVTDAAAQLEEAAMYIRHAAQDVQVQLEDMLRELERQPVRLSLWARIFGVRHD
jgi:hypothetical protein